MAIERLIALDNLSNVVDTNKEKVEATLDVVMADAYNDSKDCAEATSEVISELEEKAEPIILEEPETPEIEQENMYTKSLVLDESLSDFSINEAVIEDEKAEQELEEDDYLDYDMFHFVYGVVTDDWPKPKNPLDHPIRKFQHTGSDDYIGTNSNVGVPQVSTDANGNITVYADEISAFEDIKNVLDYYHISYGNVLPRVNKESRWKYSLTIEVPTTASGYPMMAEDFFAQYGLSLPDVIENHGVGKGKTANWGVTHDKKVTKDIEQGKKVLNNKAVDRIFDKYVEDASWSDLPLDKFVKDMFAELDEHNLEYSPRSLKKKFMDKFDDDFED